MKDIEHIFLLHISQVQPKPVPLSLFLFSQGHCCPDLISHWHKYRPDPTTPSQNPFCHSVAINTMVNKFQLLTFDMRLICNGLHCSQTANYSFYRVDRVRASRKGFSYT